MISKKLNLFIKNHLFFKTLICLLNQINKVCNFIHNLTFLYIVNKIGKQNSLVPLIFKTHDF